MSRGSAVSRRGLFGWFVAATTLPAVVAAQGDGIALTAMTHPTASGFGLATLKEAGASYAYDAVSYGLGYIVTREDLADDLYSRVKKRSL